MKERIYLENNVKGFRDWRRCLVRMVNGKGLMWIDCRSQKREKRI